MKKTLSLILIVLLIIGALAGCAEPGNTPAFVTPITPVSAGDTLPADSNQITELSAVVESAYFPLSAAGEKQQVSSEETAVYEKLTACRSGDYGQQSIADFNAALAPTPDELTEFLAAVADVGGSISPEDENYGFFTTTITFSAHELYCEHMGEEFTLFVSMSKQSRPCDYVDEHGETVYDFNCFVEANAAYSIDDPKLVTVAERDRALLAYKDEMQNYLNSLSEAEIAGDDIQKRLTDRSAELADRLSTEHMKLAPCEIYLLEINGEAEGAVQ